MGKTARLSAAQKTLCEEVIDTLHKDGKPFTEWCIKIYSCKMDWKGKVW